MRPTIDELLTFLNDEGVTVKETRNLPHGWWGATDLLERTIWLHAGLTDRQLLPTLLHETLHWQWHHHGHQTPRIETRVRYEVARTLINPTTYAQIEHMFYTSPWLLALELDTTVAVVQDYQASLQAGRMPRITSEPPL